MENNIRNIVLYVKNMTCVNCERKIETELREIKGILKVKADYKKNCCEVTYDEKRVKTGQILRFMDEIDYPSSMTPLKQSFYQRKDVQDIFKSLFLLCAMYLILKGSGILAFFYQIPQINVNMNMGILFVIGLFTSFHCMAMCGGLHLSQTLRKVNSDEPKVSRTVTIGKRTYNKEMMAPFFYNIGRIISYTILGAIIGGLGSVFHITIKTSGIIEVIAGIFMILMGLNLLNIFPILHMIAIRFPKLKTNKLNMQKVQHPFWVGLCNGFMPCGPLQAMQLYALSTESPWKGALSMFIFCLGTMPVMLSFGLLSNWLSRKYQHRIAYMGALLVMLLGFGMLKSGLVLSQMQSGLGTNLYTKVSSNQSNKDKTSLAETDTERTASTQTSLSEATSKSQVGVNETSTEAKNGNQNENVQKVESTFDSYSYKPIKVKRNTPVVWTIHVEKGFLTGCNYRMIIPEYNLEKELKEGDNVIEFTPTTAGEFSYSCWMGMVQSSITVTK